LREKIFDQQIKATLGITE